MAATFTWTEDWTGEDAIKPRNFSIAYGDGYVERLGNGINTQLATLSLTFSCRTWAVMTAIWTFLQTQAGVSAFNFQPYGDSASSLWTCNDFKRKPTGVDNWQITATFVQVVA